MLWVSHEDNETICRVKSDYARKELLLANRMEDAFGLFELGGAPDFVLPILLLHMPISISRLVDSTFARKTQYKNEQF